ncbi:unnamed protein product [Danaus chrysippus]|uniref:(African queen) hypothetical protein n=1 Tax=Danaus chrysippus TaxID=151541 RepID=A0A8J2QIC8_9NEOP|nr:unnamed protein product [Danaus chrysippus]
MDSCNNQFSDLKCLDTRCSTCSDNDDQMVEINIDSSNNDYRIDSKCWCNREDCCMYVGGDCDYGQQNMNPILSDIPDNNYTSRYTYNNSECTTTESDSVSETTSDESLSTLTSGIKTVIYGSVSSKDASLPRDIDEDLNENECSKTKAACVVT